VVHVVWFVSVRVLLLHDRQIDVFCLHVQCLFHQTMMSPISQDRHTVRHVCGHVDQYRRVTLTVKALWSRHVPATLTNKGLSPAIGCLV